MGSKTQKIKPIAKIKRWAFDICFCLGWVFDVCFYGTSIMQPAAVILSFSEAGGIVSVIK